MSPTFVTILQLIGFATGTVLLGLYRQWKTNRPHIPMELRDGVWVPDGKLKRWERRAKWSLWIGVVVLVALGFSWLYILIDLASAH